MASRRRLTEHAAAAPLASKHIQPYARWTVIDELSETHTQITKPKTLICEPQHTSGSIVSEALNY